LFQALEYYWAYLFAPVNSYYHSADDEQNNILKENVYEPNSGAKELSDYLQDCEHRYSELDFARNEVFLLYDSDFSGFS